MFMERLIEPRAGEEVANVGTSDNPSGFLVSIVNGGGRATTSGVRINEATAESIPVVYACVNIIAETVGQLPWKLMRRLPEGGKLPDTNHPLYSLLHDLPNPEMTSQDFREALTRLLALWGNTYAEIERDPAGQVKALWPLLPWCMRVDREPANNRLRYRYTLPNGEIKTWIWSPLRPPVMHLRINSLDGVIGRSPVRVLMDSLGLTKATEEYGARFYANNATPPTVLSHPGRLSKNAKQNLRDSFESRHRGLSNAHRMAILEEGLKVERIGIPQNEAQFLETRGLQIEEGARIYRVPLWMVQHMTKTTSWGTGIEQMGIGFVTYTAMPWLVRWNQGVARDLLTMRSFKTHESVFVTQALVRGDFKTRMDGYWQGRQAGLYNPDEMRGLEDMPPRTDPGGKQFLVPSNMTTAGAQTPDPPEPPADEDVDALDEETV